MEDTTQQVYDALRRKALGETLCETQEEYAFEEGEEVLKKRKVVTKQISPDLAAMRFLLESGGEDLSTLTDQELAALQEELQRICLSQMQKELLLSGENSVVSAPKKDNGNC